MMNYAKMNEREQENYDAFADEVQALRGVTVYDGDEPYVELKKCAYKHIEEVCSIVAKYKYAIADEYESDGSDYTAYYIWLKESATNE